jgi:hypothetical protein
MIEREYQIIQRRNGEEEVGRGNVCEESRV